MNTLRQPQTPPPSSPPFVLQENKKNRQLNIHECFAELGLSKLLRNLRTSYRPLPNWQGLYISNLWSNYQIPHQSMYDYSRRWTLQNLWLLLLL